MKTLRCLMAGLLLPLGGCYSYTPTGADALRPQAEVRAHLTRSSADALAGAVGGDLVVVGEVVRWNEDELGLSVWRADLRVGDRFEPQRQMLSIPWSGISALEERRLSYWKTGALLGGITVAAALILRSVFGGGGAGDPPGDGGTPF